MISKKLNWFHQGTSNGDGETDRSVIPASPSIAASPHWSVPSKKPSGFSPIIAFCFTINYTIGTGFLTIPWAFVQGGLALSSILLIIATVGSDIAKGYILETMARAEVMLDDQVRWIKKNADGDEQQRYLIHPFAAEKPLPNVKNEDSKKENYGSMVSFQPATKLHDQDAPNCSNSNRTKYLVKNRKFELNTLCRIYLGKQGLRIFTVFICLYMCGLLWAYTSVFSSAMARAAPVFGNGDEYVNYTCYAIIFGLIVIPLSCLELEEQVALQVTLTGCRFVMVFLMLGTCAQCAEDTGIDLKKDNEPELFQPSGFNKILPIVIMANLFHHSIPGLAYPVAEKKKLGAIFKASIFFTASAYVVLGVLLGSVFGKGIEQSSNLNWQGFHGGTGTIDDKGNIIGSAWWAKAVSLFIVCFPACDVVSAFPLNAITLGNNMFGSYFGSKIHEVEVSFLLILHR
jgi:amino acid permease